MIGAIAWREFRQIMAAPMAWVVLGLAQAAAAWWFLLLVEQYRTRYESLVVRVNSPMGVNDLVLLPFFGSALLIGMLLLGMALMAMRLVAEERRSGSLQLLYASPVSMVQIALGKYFAALGFLLVLVLPWVLMPLVLQQATVLDFGRLASAGLGLTMLAAVFAAVALFASSVSLQPGLAAALSVAIAVALMGINSGVDAIAGQQDPLADHLSLLTHYEPLVQGVVSTVNLGFFTLVVIAFVGLAVRRLDVLRLQA
jgi:ABC-2 type transport system permease protein